MTQFPVHTLDSAPAGSQDTLRQVKASVGMVPNLAAAMAESPSLVRGFFGLREVYHESSLEPVEIEVLSLTNAFENGCTYCMALHSTFARQLGLSDASLAALRTGKPPVEPRMAALSNLSRALVNGRGHVEAEELERFYAAGMTPANALDVVLGVAVSVLANYSQHLAHPPLDEAFRSQAWTPPAEAAGQSAAAGTAS